MRAFNLRGTNGSGKTTVARAVIKEFGCVPSRLEGKKVRIYQGQIRKLPLFVLGDYHTDCGGCDTIPSVKIVAELLVKLREQGHGVVFYEGLMISHMLGTVGATVHPWGMDHTMGFLDTPVQTCIDRVLARRMAKGNTRPFDPNKNLVKDYRAVQQCMRNAVAGGFTVTTVPHLNAAEFCIGYMKQQAL